MTLSFYFCPIVSATLTFTYFLTMRVMAIRTRLAKGKEVIDKRGSNQNETFVFTNDEEMMKNPNILLQETLYNINTVIYYGLEDYFCNLIEVAIDYVDRDLKKKVVTNSFLWGLSQCTQMFINAFAYWFGSFLIQRGTITLDNFTNALFTFMFTGSYAGKLMSNRGDMESAKSTYYKYYPLMTKKSVIDVRDDGGIKITNMNNIQGKVEIKNVVFRYISRPNVPVYNNLTFSCESKKTTAIVGETGSGKSTIMSLLMRFYDLKNDHVIFNEESISLDKTNENKKMEQEMKNVTENVTGNGKTKENYTVFKNDGQILIDDIDIRDYNIRDLRKLFSMVSQEPMLFNMSIYENIKFGNPDANFEDVKKACKLAAIDEFIESLPNKYDTNVGPFGKSLSGGQKQRVAIARALLREPKILLLDEATSSLDSNSEKLIENTIVDIKNQANRTIITIAHRIASIKRSDKIVVFNNPNKDGTFVQAQKTHEQLIADEDTVYKKYVKLAQ
uniref:Uncharacterized protein n=1 Tax=Piliocolobus tephrosceles TaxID=591936 RepID=A0A8C9GJ07_9PRIM